MLLDPNWWAAFFCVAFIFVFTGATLALAYELWSIRTHHQPITWVVRTQEQVHPRWVVLVLMILCLLLGHLAKF